MNTNYLEQAAEQAGSWDNAKISGILSAWLITSNTKIEVVRDRLKRAIDSDEHDLTVILKAMVEFLS